MIQEVTPAGFKRVGRSSEWYRQSLSVQAGRNEAGRIANESFGHPVQQREQSTLPKRNQRCVSGASSGFDFQFDFNTRSQPINDPDQAIHGETCQVGVADT